LTDGLASLASPIAAAHGFSSADLDEFLDILRQLIREPAVVGA